MYYTPHIHDETDFSFKISQKENWGSVCILVSNGAMKLTYLHLNLTIVEFVLSIFKI